jgi:hypothetical protein
MSETHIYSASLVKDTASKCLLSLVGECLPCQASHTKVDWVGGRCLLSGNHIPFNRGHYNFLAGHLRLLLDVFLNGSKALKWLWFLIKSSLCRNPLDIMLLWVIQLALKCRVISWQFFLVLGNYIQEAIVLVARTNISLRQKRLLDLLNLR